MPTPNATKTLYDVCIAVKTQFGDMSGVQITDSDITRWVNQAQTEIVNKTPIIQATVVTPSVIGTQTYVVPDDMIQLESVMFDGNILQASNFENIRAELGDDNSIRGTPMYWYVWANQIYLWPIPSEVKTISVNYSKMPIQVASLSDKLGLPDRYFDRVCEFVTSKAYELDEDWPANQVMRKQFENKLDEGLNSDKNMVGAWFVATDSAYE